MFILQALKESSNFKLRWTSVALLVALVAGSGLDILVGLHGGNVNLETPRLFSLEILLFFRLPHFPKSLTDWFNSLSSSPLCFFSSVIVNL